MLHPTPRCARLLAASLPLALLPALGGDALWIAWALGLATLVLAFAIDAALCLPARAVQPELHVAPRAVLGEELALELAFPAPPRAAVITWKLEVDERCSALAPQLHAMPAREPSRARAALTALRRGRAELAELWLRWNGPLGLARRASRRTLGAAIQIDPDVRSARGAALRVLADERHGARSLRTRHQGEGSEFTSLREYVPGMDHRRIHWKASARHRAPLCAQHRAERDHQVLLVLDTGHLMSEPVGGRSELDLFVQVALALSWVALRTGDRVGCAAVDAELRAFLAPARGSAQQLRIERAASALEPRPVETNFARGVLEIASRLHRRSLIVWFTDFVDSVSAELMLAQLGHLARRHLVLFVTVEDPALRALVERSPESVREVCAAAVMGSFLDDRKELLQRLRRAGLLVLAAAPEALGPRVLQRYLDIQARELVG